MDDNRLVKIAKDGKSNIPRPPGRPPKCWCRSQHHRRTSTLDKIQNIIPKENHFSLRERFEARGANYSEA